MIFLTIFLSLFSVALAIWFFSTILSLPKPVPIVVFVTMVAAYFRGFAQAMGVGKQQSTALDVPAPPRRRENGKEPAYPHYLAGQARRDFQHAQKAGWRRMMRAFARERGLIWVGWFGKFSKAAPDRQPPVRQPGNIKRAFGAVRLAGAFVSGAFAIGTMAVAAATQSAVLLVVRLVAYATIGVLRVLDGALLRIRHVRIHCTDPKCYRAGIYPAYACPNCRTHHRDVRPGRYGVLRRTCSCGTKLPTSLLLGSHKLDAFCPNCDQPLVKGAGQAPEIVLPVFGATSSGKTQLMVVLMLAIEGMARRRGGAAEFRDEDSRSGEEKARRELAERGQVSATSRAEGPRRSHSIYVRPRRGSARFVHVFDAAGEFFNQTDDLQDLGYLRLADTFLFTVDPLSIEQLWDRLGSDEQTKYAPIRAQRDPEFVFGQVSTTLTQMGVKTSKARLIVTVTKSDLVTRLLEEDGVRSDDRTVQHWLADTLEQGNLLRAMKLAFAEVRFFLTSAVVDSDNDVDSSVERLAGWTLARHGLRLTA
jgi:hypothetical protein